MKNWMVFQYLRLSGLCALSLSARLAMTTTVCVFEKKIEVECV